MNLLKQEVAHITSTGRSDVKKSTEAVVGRVSQWMYTFTFSIKLLQTTKVANAISALNETDI